MSPADHAWVALRFRFRDELVCEGLVSGGVLEVGREVADAGRILVEIVEFLGTAPLEGEPPVARVSGPA